MTFHLPITKWAYSIPSRSKIQEALRRAFRVALAEPLGPGAPRRVEGDPARERPRPSRSRLAYRPVAARLRAGRSRPRGRAGLQGETARPGRRRRRHPRGRARCARAPCRSDRHPGRDAAIPSGRFPHYAPPRARPARPQRMVEREPHPAPGRRGDRGRRAPRPFLDPVPLRDHQPRGRAHPPQHGGDRHRRRVPGRAGGGRLDAELRRRACRPRQGQVGVGRRATRRAATGIRRGKDC